VNRKLLPAEGILKARRLFNVEYNVPCWVTNMLGGPPQGLTADEITCNQREKSLIARAINCTYSRVFRVTEVVEYKQHPENPAW
jgi:hypothetical protein